MCALGVPNNEQTQIIIHNKFGLRTSPGDHIILSERVISFVGDFVNSIYIRNTFLQNVFMSNDF